MPFIKQHKQHTTHNNIPKGKLSCFIEKSDWHQWTKILCCRSTVCKLDNNLLFILWMGNLDWQLPTFRSVSWLQSLNYMKTIRTKTQFFLFPRHLKECMHCPAKSSFLSFTTPAMHSKQTNRHGILYNRWFKPKGQIS